MSATRAYEFFLSMHFVGFGMWLSGLFTTSYFLLFRNQEQDGGFRTRLGKMARGTAIVADVGATLAIIAGVYLAVKEHAFTTGHWLQVKLAIVALVVAYHVFLRMRVRKASEGDPTPFPGFGVRVLGIGIMLITLLAVFKPFS